MVRCFNLSRLRWDSATALTKSWWCLSYGCSRKCWPVRGWSRANARRQLSAAAKRRRGAAEDPRRRDRKCAAAAATGSGRRLSVDPCRDGRVPWVSLTRARPCRHNDSAHVEQRNNDRVRRHAFRYRYEGPEEMVLLNELWTLVAVAHEERPRAGTSGMTRRVRDQPRNSCLKTSGHRTSGHRSNQRASGHPRLTRPGRDQPTDNQIQTRLITRLRVGSARRRRRLIPHSGLAASECHSHLRRERVC